MSSSPLARGSRPSLNLLLLWQGQTISRLGDQAFLIAEMMLIGRATGSSLALGAVLLADFVPSLLIAPFAGALADRRSRRRILITCDLAAAFALMMAASLIALGHSAAVITVVVAGTTMVKAVIGTFFGPAFSALVVDLVPRERLPRAQGLLGTSGAIAGLLGQAVAGIAFDHLGGAWLLAIDGISFLVSGLACTLLRVPRWFRPTESTAPQPSLWRSGMAGLALIWRHPVLRRISLANTVFGLVGIPSFVAMPALLRAVGGDGSWLGWTYAAGGVGGLLAGSITQWFPRDRPGQVRIALLAGIACNVPYALMAAAIDPWQVVMASGVTGLFCSIGGAAGGGLILARVPRAWQGRFNAGSSVISRMLMPIGMLGGGAMADSLGPHLVYGLGGGLSIALSLAMMADRKYRRFLRGGP